jgi:hypothetical protein
MQIRFLKGIFEHTQIEETLGDTLEELEQRVFICSSSTKPSLKDKILRSPLTSLPKKTVTKRGSISTKMIEQGLPQIKSGCHTHPVTLGFTQY